MYFSAWFFTDKFKNLQSFEKKKKLCYMLGGGVGISISHWDPRSALHAVAFGWISIKLNVVYGFVLIMLWQPNNVGWL